MIEYKRAIFLITCKKCMYIWEFYKRIYLNSELNLKRYES